MLHNVDVFTRTYQNISIAPVLKSNAYGHGIVEVGRILDQTHAPFFVVDSLHEAHILRRNGVRTPILVIGYTPPPNMVTTPFPHISFTITNLDQLVSLAGIVKKRTYVHLKIDTGMHRQGILEDEIPRALELLTQSSHLVLEGICSHFADADTENNTQTQQQITAWERCVEECKKYTPALRYIHISASAGARYTSHISGNVLRLGIGLYGIDPSPVHKLPLRPTLRLETIVSSLKKIPAGARIGYNGTFVAPAGMIVATIPMGYFEGIDRRLSNCGSVLINDTSCPILGRVSMNITTVDVTHLSHVAIGDRVVVISDTPTHPNTVVRIAEKAHTIPWEILVHIPQHLRRIVIDEADAA